MELVGNDRLGIVKEVTAELTAPSALDVRILKADLEAISNDLMVEMTLGEII